MQSIMRIVGTGDINIFLYLNHNMQCRPLDKLMPLGTFLGGSTFTVIISLFLMLFGKGEVRFAAAYGSIALAASFVTGFFLKKLLGRPRPYMAIPSIHKKGDKIWTDFSFPSGHTAAGFSLAINYAMFFPQNAVPLAIAAVFVGVSRIYLGHHYPTDTLAGAIIGTLAAVTVHML